MNDSSSLFGLLKGLNINKILNTASKTINFVNKAIPMYKEIKPTIGTLKKTFLKSEEKESVEIVDEIKESRPLKTKKNIPNTKNVRNNFNDTLTFFQ